MTIQLCPAQQQGLDGLLRLLPIGSVFAFSGATGSGLTTVLHEVHRSIGGVFLPMKDLLDGLRGQHPLALEETFEQLVMKALARNDTVILDDVDLLDEVINSGCRSYPRGGLLEIPFNALTSHATETGKKLIFGSAPGFSSSIQQRCFHWRIPHFDVEDYAFLAHQFLTASVADRLDYKKVYRFAPHLSVHQLKGVCASLRHNDMLDTEEFIDYLRSQHLVSNVDLEEVQQVSLSDLKGVDDVIAALEANIILPLENDELATELNLKPKRGVLLAGPPGTGKTTIGRALAHRLKSKFFLVDGTFISGTDFFYGKIHCVFEDAKRNAPSIIFIDDSDVIFESGEELGLYRYLLTMLDGLESETVGRVCVMLTAMDVSNLPPALIRSGRIELWLQTRLPDAEARAELLLKHLGGLPAAIGAVDLAAVVAATDGFTGADIKRLVEDAKILFANDKVKGHKLRPATEYYLDAIREVRLNKERYSEAEARARKQRPARPIIYQTGDMAS
jgi:transitional endoplasmic reticulum ATPase